MTSLLAFTLTISLTLTFTTNAELVTAAVGIVRNQTVLTSREVQALKMLDLALTGKVDKEALRPLAIDSQSFAKTAQESLLELVVSIEAQNFNVVQLDAEEVARRQRQVTKLLKGQPAWVKLDITTKELETLLKRKLQAKKFIEFRAQSSVLPVTDAEARKYFDENKIKFGQLPFENFKENIKSYLSRNQVEKRLKDWYDILLNKYQVKNLIAEI